MSYFAPITADWTGSAQAQRILASMAKHPPAVATIPPEQRWTSRSETYVGYRVDCLTHILNERRSAALAEGDRTNDYTAFEELMTQPSVEDAIDEALGRLPHLVPITTKARTLDPAIWGDVA